MQPFLRFCVGLDISKDDLQVCLSVIDADGRVTVKGTTKVANQLSGFTTLMNWVSRHHKLELPLRYVMESTAQAALRGLPRSCGLASLPA